jgi:hypothetical protein
MAPDPKLLAREWIAYWEEHGRTNRFPDSDISSVLDDLSQHNPEACWAVILEILDTIDARPENPLFQVLAAGELEDLLSDQPHIIDRVEAEARRNPKFSLLLGGVWEGGMTPEVWARVQKCRSSAW